MDIAAFLLNKKSYSGLPEEFRKKVQNRLLAPQDGQKPYEHIFLMKWVWPCGPHGGKLGNDVIVGAHDGVILVVGPDYKLPSNDCKDISGAWAKACEVARPVAHYVSLKCINTGKPMEGQKLAILIGTRAQTAAAPDGMICLDVKKALSEMRL